MKDYAASCYLFRRMHYTNYTELSEVVKQRLNRLIGMVKLARAVRRELLKLGRSEPHFLTLYPD